MKSFKLFILENKIQILIVYFITVSMVFLSLSVSENTKIFYDHAFSSNKLSELRNTFLQIVFSYVVILILSIWSNILSHKILYKGMLGIRKCMLKSFLHTSFDYFSKNTTGKIWSETVSTTNEICPFFYSILLSPVDMLEALIYASIIFSSSFTGGLIITAFVPLIIAATFFSGKSFRKKRGDGLSIFRKIASFAVETLSATKLIKTTSSHDYFLEKFSKNHRIMNDIDIKVSVINNYVDSIQNIVVILAPLITVFLSSGITSGNSVGNLVILYTFTPLFFNSFRSLYSKLFNFFGVKPSLSSVENVLSLRSERFSSKLMDERIKISIRNFEYDFDDKSISIPDFVINPGDKILISGESGLGKSTLFNCLTGIHSDFENSISINGVNIKEYDLYHLRKQIILVNQDNLIFTGNLRENIQLGLTEEVFEEDFINILKPLNLEELNAREIINNDKLSRGEKTRINLAQALLRRPDILLIDETLSSVDESLEREILEDIFSEYPGTSVVYITHRLSVKDLFDHVVSLVGTNMKIL